MDCNKSDCIHYKVCEEWKSLGNDNYINDSYGNCDLYSAIPYNPTVEPRIEYGTDGQPYKLSMTNGKEYDRPKGEWTVTKLQHGEDVTCPFCNARPTKSEYGYYLRDNFCHECGADMRKGGAESGK